MQKKKFLELIQRYEANISIGGSTLRNQGAKGVAKAARKFLSGLNLSELTKINPTGYPNVLERWTSDLMAKLPYGARNWGTARKAINVFMVQVSLNRYLAEEYGMEKLGDALETPLDSYAAKELKKRRENWMVKLPRWVAIKRLSHKESEKYQECASQVAKQEDLSRACLDIILWRPKEN